jgi:uncharacterized protein with HEPN domain
VVWDIVQEDLPSLKRDVTRILEEVEDQQLGDREEKL